MKFASVLNAVTGLLGRGSSAGGARLGALDFGVLKVALMVSGLDGQVLPAEVAAFDALARQCRGYSAENAKQAFDAALREAGYLMALAGIARSENERIAAFVAGAERAMPHGFLDGFPRDVRRAFVMWVAMAMSDGDYSGIERRAIAALRDRFADVKLDRANLAAATWAAAFPNYNPTAVTLDAAQRLTDSVKLVEDGFLDHVERLVAALDDPLAHEKANEDLAALIDS